MVRHAVLIFFLFTKQTVWALPNQILWIPDVKGLQQEVCRFEMQQLVTPIRQSTDGPGEKFNLSFGSACGFYQSEQIRLEAGLDWREGHDFAVQALSDALFGHLQLQLFDIDRRHWGLAVGAYDIGFKFGANNFNVLYLIGLHQAGVYRFGFGAYSGNSQVLVNADGNPDYQGALVGIWRKITNGDLGVELQSGFNRYGYLFLGGRWIVAPKTFCVVGYGKANEPRMARDFILVRLGIVF